MGMIVTPNPRLLSLVSLSDPLPSGWLVDMVSTQGLSYDSGTGRITAWNDQSGNDNHGAQGNTAARPLRIETGGVQLVRLDDATRRIGRATLVGGARGDSTLVLVCRPLLAGSVAQVLTGGTETDTAYQIRIETSAAWGIRQGGTVRSGGTATTGWVVAVARYGATDTLNINGVQVATGDAGSTNSDGWFLGRSINGTELDVYAKRIRAGSMSTSDETALVAYYQSVLSSAAFAWAA